MAFTQRLIGAIFFGIFIRHVHSRRNLNNKTSANCILEDWNEAKKPTISRQT